MILDPQFECEDQQRLLEKIIKPRLSSLFMRVYDQFSYYKWRFDEAGIRPEDDPLEVLAKLPFMTKRDYSMLEEDSMILADKRLFHVETTSGSTGRPKRRFQSMTDEINELRLAMRVLAGFDISKDDVVVFMDVGNPSIYIWFAKALEALGIKNTIYYGIQSDFNLSLRKLIKLNPNVLFTVPSLLARSYDTIKEMFGNNNDLKKIIYFGEKLDERFRKRIENELKVEIFTHYGGTETSTLGGECSAHDGIHIYNDYNFLNLVEPKIINETTQEGESAWTTMQIDIQPVIKYRMGDVICIDYSKCVCGRTSPRIKVIARTDDGFSIYGEKFYYDTFLDAVYSKLTETGFMQLVLSTEQKHDKLVIILPEKLKNKENDIMESLYHMNELEFFLEEKFITLELKFVPNSHFTSRKIPCIIDNRNYQ
ncbi:TPA: phenylacetate--CoA ligase family protein [bacterium]|nr:phenylacetate--CoA ligase family protein [bacterium]